MNKRQVMNFLMENIQKGKIDQEESNDLFELYEEQSKKHGEQYASDNLIQYIHDKTQC